jgi:hypothetical protein
LLRRLKSARTAAAAMARPNETPVRILNSRFSSASLKRQATGKRTGTARERRHDIPSEGLQPSGLPFSVYRLPFSIGRYKAAPTSIHHGPTLNGGRPPANNAHRGPALSRGRPLPPKPNAFDDRALSGQASAGHHQMTSRISPAGLPAYSAKLYMIIPAG